MLKPPTYQPTAAWTHIRHQSASYLMAMAFVWLCPACGPVEETPALPPSPQTEAPDDTDDLTKVDGCQSDGECAQGQICQDDDCVAGCRADTACPEGHICQEHQCVEGCRNPADCPDAMVCRALQCVPEPCANDAACGQGARCQQGTCVQIDDAPCDTDQDCGWRWRCSAQTQTCFEGQCLVHSDCPEANQRCLEGICLDSTHIAGPLRMEAITLQGITHDPNGGPTFGQRHGFGGALLDADGDQRLDLFLGTNDPQTHACLYRNTSSPGQPDFEPWPDLCQGALGQVHSALGVDMDADGRDELLALGDGIVALWHLHPEARAENLLEVFESQDTRRQCRANGALTIDFDFDGRQDLVIACSELRGQNSAGLDGPRDNITLRQTNDGRFEPVELKLDNNGSTLAVAALDANDDGLLDILLANDTYSQRDQSANGFDPGGVFLACPPDQECQHAPWRWGQDAQAWGSSMGLAALVVDGLGEHIFVSDWGPNRLVRFDDEGTPQDLADALGLSLGQNQGRSLYAWGALVDDFDRNGLDDLLVIHGPFSPGQNNQEHVDMLALQTAAGRFETFNQEIGLPGGAETTVGRGALRADLDHDGLLEVIIFGVAGPPQVYTVHTDPQLPPRCTLIPTPWLVPTQGFGLALAPNAASPWRHWDIQGQLRAGVPSHLGSPWSQGLVRFASGAVVPFDCNDQPGPISITEPQWLQLNVQGDRLTLDIQTQHLDTAPTEVTLLFQTPGGTQHRTQASFDGQLWSAELPAQAHRAMIRLDQRWIARWLALPR